MFRENTKLSGPDSVVNIFNSSQFVLKILNIGILLPTFTNKTMFVCFDLQQSLLPMKNKNQTTIRLSEQISGYMIDEISSESSEGGRRFLRNPEKRINKNVGR